MDRLIILLLVALQGLWLAPGSVRAAEMPVMTLRFEQTGGLLRTGDIVPVVVRIDTHGQVINAAELDLTFSTIGLEVDHISREQSIFTIWPDLPTWKNSVGTIHAVGGRPNGIIASDAAMMTVYFRVPASGAWEMSSAASTSILLHDGLGTALKAEAGKITINVVDSLVPSFPLMSKSNPTPETWTKGSNVDISWTMQKDIQYSFVFSTRADLDPDQVPEKTDGSEVFSVPEDGVYYFAISSFSEGAWGQVYRRRFLVDHTPPSPFTIVRLPGRQLDGHDALTWLVKDVTSGIADVSVLVGGQTLSNPTLPLRIQAAWAGQEVFVTAVDQAGNIQRATFRLSGQAYISRWVILVLALMAFGAAGTAWFVHRRHHRS